MISKEFLLGKTKKKAKTQTQATAATKATTRTSTERGTGTEIETDWQGWHLAALETLLTSSNCQLEVRSVLFYALSLIFSMPFVARALFYRTSVKGLWLRNAGTSLGEKGNEKRKRGEGRGRTRVYGYAYDDGFLLCAFRFLCFGSGMFCTHI